MRSFSDDLKMITCAIECLPLLHLLVNFIVLFHPEMFVSFSSVLSLLLCWFVFCCPSFSWSRSFQSVLCRVWTESNCLTEIYTIVSSHVVSFRLPEPHHGIHLADWISFSPSIRRTRMPLSCASASSLPIGWRISLSLVRADPFWCLPREREKTMRTNVNCDCERA